MRIGWDFLDVFVLGIQIIPSEGIGICLGWFEFHLSWASVEEADDEVKE